MEKVIPGLRPWEVLSVEQAMDQITYGGEWYREPLGSYTTGPPYIREWNSYVRVCILFQLIALLNYERIYHQGFNSRAYSLFLCTEDT